MASFRARVRSHAWLQLTYSQDKIVVRLVVDLVKDVEHLDGEIRDRAQVSRGGLLNLENGGNTVPLTPRI